jgi:hypothetical protein
MKPAEPKLEHTISLLASSSNEYLSAWSYKLVSFLAFPFSYLLLTEQKQRQVDLAECRVI